MSSIQSDRWEHFSTHVILHIENYVIPQYGDEGADVAATYTAEDCVKQAQKYLARFGRNSRPGEEKRDLVKAAHYIQKAWSKFP